MVDNVVLPGRDTPIESKDVGGGVQRQTVAIGDRAGSTDDVIGGKSETAPTTDTAAAGLNGRLQRVAQNLTKLLAPWVATAAPATTAGSYTGGDIIGGVMNFTVAAENDQVVVLDALQVMLKSNVSPSLTLIILSADLTTTSHADNDSYSLSAADVFKVQAVLPIINLGGFQQSHGTPVSISLGNLDLPVAPIAGSTHISAILVDAAGVTLGSTTDMQVTLSGRRS